MKLIYSYIKGIIKESIEIIKGDKIQLKMMLFGKIILFFAIFTLVMFFQKENFSKITYNASPQIYTNLSVYDYNDFKGVVQGQENTDKIQSTYQSVQQSFSANTLNDVNIEIIPSATFLNINTTNAAADQLSNYIETNMQPLEEGYIVRIDDKEYYASTLNDIEAAKNDLIEAYIDNSNAANSLISKTAIVPYASGNKTVTNIKVENTFEVEKAMVPVDEVANSKEELMFNILHDNQELKYDEVKNGDDLASVAKRNNISLEEILLNNQNIDQSTLLYDGEQLVVNDVNDIFDIAYYYTEQKLETIPYSTEYKASDDLNLGDTEVVQAGVNGQQLVTYNSKYVNDIIKYQNIGDIEVLEKPTTEIVLKGTYEPPGLGTGNFAWPSSSHFVSCGFGCYSGHTGIDIQNYYGAPVLASDNGTVEYVGYASDYGYHVLINHNNGYETMYAHMSQMPSVSVGQNVEQGQVIGYEGATGQVTGEHIHFEIRVGGVRVDPLPYLS